MLATIIAATFLVPQDNPNPKELWDAAFKGDLKQVAKLVEAGADVEARNDYGRTALSLASGRGHTDVMKALIKAGADLETKDRFYNFTPLTIAVLGKQPGSAEVLVEAGAKGAGAALMFVVTDDQPMVVEALLKAKDLTEAQVSQALAAAKQAERKANVALLEPVAKRLKAEQPDKPEPDKPKSDDAKPKEMTLSKAQLDAFAGKFAGPQDLEMDIKPGENQLQVTISAGGQTLTFAPTGTDEFAMASAGITLKFKRDGDKVSGFTWESAGNELAFKRATKKAEPDKPVDDAADWTDYETGLADTNWPSFRGHLSRGIADGQEIATEWDAKTGKNIAWKARIPGMGFSCPISWGDKVFVTTAIPVDSDDPGEIRTGLYGDVDSVEDDREYDFRLYCLSLESGAVLWQRTCHRGKPRVKRHAKSSHANPTPVTDGKHVVASFGSEGVYCFDLDGKKVWEKNFGFLDSGWFFDRDYQWGFGSSPTVHDGTLFLQCDIQDQSFLAALDLATGEEKWRTERDEIPTWSSPIGYVDPAGQSRVIVSGTRRSALYDAKTGEELWSMGGMSEIVVPTPQVTPNYVLLASGYAPIRPILAIEHHARGELSFQDASEGDGDEKTDEAKEGEEEKKAPAGDSADENPFSWKLTRGGSYLPTPVVYKGYVFVCGNGGVLTCYSAKTGKRLSRLRLRGKGARSFTGSPIAANGKLFITAEQGQTFVVPAKPNAKIESVNVLGESVLTTAAIANGNLLIRGDSHVYAIKERPEPKEPEDLVLVAGQSNAVGFDAKPSELPASDIDANIRFWWRSGDPPPDDHDTRSNGWTTLKPQSLGKPDRSKKRPRQYGNFAQAEGGFGPEIGFARAMHEANQKNFSIVKAAFSGTGLARDWDPHSDGDNGSCYRALVSEVRKAIAAGRKEGRTFRIRAILWVQGESDANKNDAPKYAERLTAMMNALRRDLDAAEMVALVAVNTKFGNGKNKFMPEIVKQQQLAAKDDAKCVYVDTADAPIANGAHYDTKGTLMVGQWFAKALLEVEAK